MNTLNNPETYVLTHNRFKTYMVLIFSDLNEARIYKMPYRDSPHREIEILMSFDYLHSFRPNEHTEDYHVRKPNNANFLFKIEDKKYIHVGKKLFCFETDGEIVKYSSEHGHNDIKYSFARGKENIYFMLEQKYIPVQKNENSTEKNEYDYLYNNEDIVEYGNDFLY